MAMTSLVYPKQNNMAGRLSGVSQNMLDIEAAEDNLDQDSYETTIESTPLKIDDRYIKENKFLERLRIPDDTASKDSDSLIHDSVFFPPEKFDPHISWWNHPKVRQNWKIVLAAFVLLVIGLGLLATGVLVEIVPMTGFKGFVFFIAGAICFIPGAYHVVYVYCAVKGRRGFDFHNLPLFN